MTAVPGSRVAVLGLGRTGFESARFLKRQGLEVFVSEKADSEPLRRSRRELEASGIAVETGGHSEKALLGSDWILISPGISPRTPVYRRLLESGKKIVSEIEAASWFCRSEKIIAVTGTSGKTTVSTLIARVLAARGEKTHLCGNIGHPWIAEVERIGPEDPVVVEVSSFQLLHCGRFRPQTGVLLNLSPNHLDWHESMEDYVRAKLRLFDRQQEKDAAVIRAKDRETYFPHYVFRGKVVSIDPSPAENENEAAVRAVAALYGCPKETVDGVLADFTGLEHRLERVSESGGVVYINDSKSTTPASLAWALERFPDGSVILIAGGRAKSENFAELTPLLKRKVKKAVLIGEARPLLARAWKGSCPLEHAAGLREAVRTASGGASRGDTVLFSPACASFDMFRNYEERGTLFKQMIRERTASTVA